MCARESDCAVRFTGAGGLIGQFGTIYESFFCQFLYCTSIVGN